MRGTRLSAIVVLGCCFALAACDKSTEKREDLEAAGAAMLGDGKDDKSKELEAKEAELRKQKFAEKQAKEAELTAKLDALAAKLVKAPDKASKDVAAACEAMMPIYEEWIKVIYFDDDGAQLGFFDNKHKELGVIKAKCAKLQSAPAADCIMEVIRGVAVEDFPEADAKILQGQPEYLFDKCIESFAEQKANWKTLVH